MDNDIVAHETRHYDPETGDWDGQLAHPDIAERARPAGGRDRSDVTLLDRWQWSFRAISVHKLSPSQALVLSRIAFRAGTEDHVCKESQKKMGVALDMHEDTVRRAVRDLEKKGLVAYERRFNSPGHIYPSFKPFPSETGNQSQQKPGINPSKNRGQSQQKPGINPRSHSGLTGPLTKNQQEKEQKKEQEASNAASLSLTFSQKEQETKISAVCQKCRRSARWIEKVRSEDAHTGFTVHGDCTCADPCKCGRERFREWANCIPCLVTIFDLATTWQKGGAAAVKWYSGNPDAFEEQLHEAADAVDAGEAPALEESPPTRNNREPTTQGRVETDPVKLAEALREYGIEVGSSSANEDEPAPPAPVSPDPIELEPTHTQGTSDQPEPTPGCEREDVPPPPAPFAFSDEDLEDAHAAGTLTTDALRDSLYFKKTTWQEAEQHDRLCTCGQRFGVWRRETGKEYRDRTRAVKMDEHEERARAARELAAAASGNSKIDDPHP